MVRVAFDTLKFVEKLRAAGVPEAQAKAMSEAQVEIFAEATDNSLATKMDISEVKTEIKVLQWMIGFVLAGNAAIILKNFF